MQQKSAGSRRWPATRWPHTHSAGAHRCPSSLVLQILLPVPQAQWPRDTLLNITVAATNNFGESKNSTAYEFTTPL